MTIISNCCSQNFIKSGLAERLANLLNYSLSIFTTSKGMKLKVIEAIISGKKYEGIWVRP